MTDLQKPEERLTALLIRLRNLQLREGPPKDIGLSMPKFGLLRMISHSPGCGVNDISHLSGLKPPTISVGVRRLVREGLLERRRDPQDKRARPLYLTEKGETLIQQVRAHRNQGMHIFMEGLDSEEQGQFLGLLEKAINAAETKMNSPE